MKGYKSIGIVVSIAVVALLGAWLIELPHVSQTEQQKETVQQEPIELEVWTIEGAAYEGLQEITKRYEVEYPYINFNLRVFNNEGYKIKLDNALVTGNVPDMFFMWGYEQLREYIRADKVLNIIPYLEGTDYLNRINLEAMDAVMYEGGLYGLPLQGSQVVLYCNTALFEQYGVSYPETYEDLLAVSEVFIEDGIIPLTLGAREPWMLSFLYMSLAGREVGLETILRSVDNTDVLLEPGFKEAADKMLELMDKGVLGEDALNLTLNEAEMLFVGDEAAMLLSGTFSVPSMQREGIKVVEPIDFPRINPEVSQQEGMGTFSDTFALSQQIKNPEVVVPIYLAIMEELAAYMIEVKESGIPVWEETGAIVKGDLLQKCITLFEDKVYYQPYDQVMDSTFVDKHFGALVELMQGEITSEQFIYKHVE